ncbi:LysR family transcriptional regulator [Azospirillum sp. RWY-5-1]|uniref:LysR family transcriptional regulator n=1 Tax=Azospirillum oleiclasticum TaxID=2735135 RepID=A0ABX2TGS0_9PROT|nr:LysR family transcriptional regulator [Azospirillum oleiclasticum]NYZ22945.1 LysR family transcriptional regulator [Azospirillum oleiclasticum]
MTDTVNLNRLAYFAAVVETGSYTAAARRLGITKAVVSQQVARLEAELGTGLLVRTTRRVEPTDAGRRFHARCARILREAEEAVREAAQTDSTPRGTLRVTAPTDYGTTVVVPVVAAFLARHPHCQADVTLTDETIDLGGGSLDLSVRVGWLEESGLRARRLGGFRQLLVAAPAFAGALAGLDHPRDLAALPFVANKALRDPLHWSFERDGEEPAAVRLHGVLALNSTPAVLAAVLQGAGLSVLPDYLAADGIAAGRLLHALPSWRLPAGGIHAVFPPVPVRPPRVTAFVELLAAAARAH